MIIAVFGTLFLAVFLGTLFYEMLKVRARHSSYSLRGELFGSGNGSLNFSSVMDSSYVDTYLKSSEDCDVTYRTSGSYAVFSPKEITLASNDEMSDQLKCNPTSLQDIYPPTDLA